MKNIFKEHFFPSNEDLDKIWGDSLIVFDTCTILNLYKYTKTTREQYLKLLESCQDRVWLPYQVVSEFFNNRLSTIRGQEKGYGAIKVFLEKQYVVITNELNRYKKHSFIDIESIKKMILKQFEEVYEKLDVSRKKHPDYFQEDTILERISKIFDSKVGEDFTDQGLGQLFKEGEERYKKLVPPGFCDSKEKVSKGNRALYGDLIVWKQIMQYSKEANKDIIFVTDDRKEDWWEIFEGETISPRKELYKEFVTETKHSILIYKADKFLSEAKHRLNSDLDENSIKEVTELNKQNLQTYARAKRINNAAHWPNSKDFNLFFSDKIQNKNIYSISEILDFMQSDYYKNLSIEQQLIFYNLYKDTNPWLSLHILDDLEKKDKKEYDSFIRECIEAPEVYEDKAGIEEYLDKKILQQKISKKRMLRSKENKK